MIIAGFKLVGKTTAKQQLETQTEPLKVVDLSFSGSELEDHIDELVLTIKEHNTENDIVLIPCHLGLIKALVDAGEQPRVVYPTLEHKDLYKDRTSSPEHHEWLDFNWDTEIQSLIDYDDPLGRIVKYELLLGQYLSDAVKYIV